MSASTVVSTAAAMLALSITSALASPNARRIESRGTEGLARSDTESTRALAVRSPTPPLTRSSDLPPSGTSATHPVPTTGETVSGGLRVRVVRFRDPHAGQYLTPARFFDPAIWTPTFASLVARTLAGTEGEVYWEVSPFTAGTFASDVFECAVIDAASYGSGPPINARPASPDDFSDKFRDVSGPVIAFDSKDDTNTRLVSPRRAGTPAVPDETYKSLTPFLRGAAVDHQVQLWKKVCAEVRRFLASSGAAGQRIFVCTDGRAVPWLHVRIMNERAKGLAGVQKFYKP